MNSKEYITYSFTRQGQTSDLIYSVEVSEDLKEWKKGIAVLEATTINADGTIKENVEIADEFFR